MTQAYQLGDLGQLLTVDAVGNNITLAANSVLVNGSINAASHTVGTTFIANSSQLTITTPVSANGSVGTAGYVLKSNGATGSPYWTSGGITVRSTAGSGGTVNVSATNVTAINFDDSTGLHVTDQGSGNVFVNLGSGFKYITVAGQTTITAVGEDTLNVANGTLVTLATTNTAPKTLTIDLSSNVVTNAQLSGNLANYQTTAGLNANIASYLPTYTGTVNGSVIQVGTTFVANSSQLTITTPLSANGSVGTAGYVLTTNGATGSPYWAIASAGVNVAAQYTWSNTQTFTNAITYSGNLVLQSGLSANGSFGTTNQVLTTNGSATYWSTVSSSGGGALPARQIYTANGSVNTFTVTGGYYANNLDVYLNGIKLQNGVEANVQNGSTFTILTANPANGSVIEVVGTSALTSTGVSTVVNQQITANGSANSFAITGGYIANSIAVFLNGVKQIPGTDVFITSGANVGFAVTPSNNHIIDVYGYQTSVSYTSNAIVVGNTTIGLSNVTTNTITTNAITTNVITTNTVTTNAISANGSVGSNGQVLTSNGSAVYWGAGNGPAFSAYQSSAQSLSSATTTLLQFQTKEFDTNSAFNNTGSTVGSAPAWSFNPQVAGYYQIIAAIAVSTTPQETISFIYKNGTRYKNGTDVSASSGSSVVTSLVYLNGSSDYVQIYGYVTTGQNLAASINSTYFQGIMVRGP